MSHYGMKKTESTLNLRGIPFWDSSDPTRNPQPLPARPDISPDRTPTSPTRSRTLNSVNEERITELLDLSKEINKSQTKVEKSVNEALMEFGSLAYRSRDNATALGQLQSKAQTTEDCVRGTQNVIEEGIQEIRDSLENDKHSRKTFTTIADSLLCSTKDVVETLRIHGQYLEDISNQPSRSSSDKYALESLENKLSELSQEISVQSERIQKHIAILDKSMTPELDRLGGQITKKSDEILGKISKNHSELGNNLLESQESLVELKTKIDRLTGLQQETVKKMLQMTENQPERKNEKDIQKEKENSEIQFEKIFEKFDEQSKNIKQTHETHDAKWHLMFAESNENLKKSVDSQNDELKRLLKRQSDSYHLELESIQTKLKNIQVISESFDEKTQENLKEIVSHQKKQLGEHIKRLEKKIAELNDKDESEIDKLVKNIDVTCLQSNQTISIIQADVRSLIDLQFGDKEDFGKQLQTILSKLTDLKENDDNALEKANKKIIELENQLKKIDLDQNGADQVGKFQQSIIDQKQTQIDKLNEKIELLDSQKVELQSDIASLKTEMSFRLQELDKVDARILSLEQRMSQTILDKSRSILGSTALTLINNSGTPKRLSTNRNDSPGKRNLSLAPSDSYDRDDENARPTDGVLSISKGRNGPDLSVKSNRSVSEYIR